MKFSNYRTFIVLSLIVAICAGCSSTTKSPNSTEILNKQSRENQRIALLVPLHGQFAAAGKAVRDGFFTAYYAAASNAKPKLQIYDTSQHRNIKAVYQQALNAGATFVVGPLTKNHVKELSEQSLAVPTLMLNYIQIRSPHKNLYLLGISPKLQAQYAAMKAFSPTTSQALVIYPNNAWGKQIAQTFAYKWQQLGGNIVDQLAYKRKHLRTEIANLLHTKYQEERPDDNNHNNKTDDMNVNQTIEQPPKRRQDFNIVFVVATPQNGRQIIPLLKFYYVNDVPIYSTSLIYTGTPQANKDRDLNGVIFCDMLWAVRPSPNNNKLYHKIITVWPHQFKNNARMYALGGDAYQIATNYLQPIVGGVSGGLYRNRQQEYHRQLVWTQIRNGKPHIYYEKK